MDKGGVDPEFERIKERTEELLRKGKKFSEERGTEGY
jgi:hypothetical protein